MSTRLLYRLCLLLLAIVLVFGGGLLPSQDEASDLSPEPLPERPTELNQTSVESYAAQYYEVFARNRAIRHDDDFRKYTIDCKSVSINQIADSNDTASHGYSVRVYCGGFVYYEDYHLDMESNPRITINENTTTVHPD